MPVPGGRGVRLAREEQAYSILEQQLPANPGDDLIDALPRLQICKNEWLYAAHDSRITIHHSKVGADVWRQVRFVDYEQIGARDSRAALARHFIPSCDIDDVNRGVNEFGTETGGQIVPAAFKKQDLESGESLLHFGNGVEIDRCIFSYRGVRASACLHSNNAAGGK